MCLHLPQSSGRTSPRGEFLPHTQVTGIYRGWCHYHLLYVRIKNPGSNTLEWLWSISHLFPHLWSRHKVLTTQASQEERWCGQNRENKGRNLGGARSWIQTPARNLFTVRLWAGLNLAFYICKMGELFSLYQTVRQMKWHNMYKVFCALPGSHVSDRY